MQKWDKIDTFSDCSMLKDLHNDQLKAGLLTVNGFNNIF